MRIVVALGGNALLRRGEPMSSVQQRLNVRVAAAALAPLAKAHQLVISHGNGPQVGLLALQADAYEAVESFPLDVLGAQTEGMIGYLIEQEARRLADERGWAVAPDSDGWRRVVPSPRPQHIFQIRPIRWLVEQGVIVICTGGGGIPTMYDEDGNLRGAEVVIDKDLASALLAVQLEADMLVMATDVDAVYRDWATPRAEPIRRTTPDELRQESFSAGSMGPKVEAACRFAELAGGTAAIGSLSELKDIVDGERGTIIALPSDPAAVRLPGPLTRPGNGPGSSATSRGIVQPLRLSIRISGAAVSVSTSCYRLSA